LHYQSKSFAQIVDYKELGGIVSAVHEQLSDEVKKYRSCKKKLFFCRQCHEGSLGQGRSRTC